MREKQKREESSFFFFPVFFSRSQAQPTQFPFPFFSRLSFLQKRFSARSPPKIQWQPTHPQGPSGAPTILEPRAPRTTTQKPLRKRRRPGAAMAARPRLLPRPSPSPRPRRSSASARSSSLLLPPRTRDTPSSRPSLPAGSGGTRRSTTCTRSESRWRRPLAW